jgi:hypothetical protein
MRLRKPDIRRRVNGHLEFRFMSKGLTSYAGLELLRRYFRMLELIPRLRRHLGGRLPSTDFGIVPMVLVLLALLVSGGRRLRHLMYLAGDPLVLRLCGLRRLPTPRTVGRWLCHFRERHLQRLRNLNAEVVAEVIRNVGLRRLTIDVDGSVVSTGQQVEWAQRGFNPHHRKVPSYYPITAYEAQSGQVLRVQNRPGNVHDGKAGVRFLRALFAQLAATLGRRCQLEFRMDGAFFRREVLELLEARGAEYAIKVPFYPWTGLKDRVRKTRAWTSVADRLSCSEHRLGIASWGRAFRVVVYRKRVQHWTAKNFQLDLFDPSDGHYEYSAVVTNKGIGTSCVAGVCMRKCTENSRPALPSTAYPRCAMRRTARGSCSVSSRSTSCAASKSRRRPGAYQRASGAPSIPSRPSTRCATCICIAPVS